MPARKPSKNKPSKYDEQFEREVQRLERIVKEAKRRGMEFKISPIPSKPEKVTRKTIEELRKITPAKLGKLAEEGEQVRFSPVKRKQKNKAISKAKRKIPGVNIADIDVESLEDAEKNLEAAIVKAKQLKIDYEAKIAEAEAKLTKINDTESNLYKTGARTVERLRKNWQKASEAIDDLDKTKEQVLTAKRVANAWNKIPKEQRMVVAGVMSEKDLSEIKAVNVARKRIEEEYMFPTSEGSPWDVYLKAIQAIEEANARVNTLLSTRDSLDKELDTFIKEEIVPVLEEKRKVTDEISAVKSAQHEAEKEKLSEEEKEYLNQIDAYREEILRSKEVVNNEHIRALLLRILDSLIKQYGLKEMARRLGANANTIGDSQMALFGIYGGSDVEAQIVTNTEYLLVAMYGGTNTSVIPQSVRDEVSRAAQLDSVEGQENLKAYYLGKKRRPNESADERRKKYFQMVATKRLIKQGG